MQYLLDTVALIYHLAETGKIGNRANRILDEIESNKDLLIISVISLMEVMYLAEKNRIAIDLPETINKINESSKFRIVDLTPSIIQVAAATEFYELHDRLILATAKWFDVPVISNDLRFKEVENISVVWD